MPGTQIKICWNDPDPHNPGEIERTTGFGDTLFMEMLAPTPKLLVNWLLWVGPTFTFPTASSDYTEQVKLQATSRRNVTLEVQCMAFGLGEPKKLLATKAGNGIDLPGAI